MTLEVVPCFMLYAGAWDLAFWMGARGWIKEKRDVWKAVSI